ncbi:MAG: bleomycin resistance protein [Chitinophagaceae bacterium]|jgi:catechol 2,3-dioxygenase-like lactoylglutathione lyase family enzyme
MLLDIVPKLPMRDQSQTKEYYITQLGFELIGDYGNYIMLKKEGIEIHFFEFKNLNPLENYGQVYFRLNSIDEFYKELLEKNITIHPNSPLEIKPWGQKEFALLDPDNNLLTFGETI